MQEEDGQLPAVAEPRADGVLLWALSPGLAGKGPLLSQFYFCVHIPDQCPCQFTFVIIVLLLQEYLVL